jgi:Peptidase family M28/PA domain
MGYNVLDNEVHEDEERALTFDDGSPSMDYGLVERGARREGVLGALGKFCPNTRRGRLLLAGGLFVVLALVVLLILVGLQLAKSGNDDEASGSGSAPFSGEPGAQLAAAITAEALQAHLNALLGVAQENGGNRACGAPGYEASVEYVSGQLSAAGYTSVTRQAFGVQVWSSSTENPPRLWQTAPAALDFVLDADFAIMTYSGSSAPEGTCGPVFRALAHGCNVSDFAGMPAGAVAFVSRSPPSVPEAQRCSFEDKVENAVARGAGGVVIFNDGEEGHTGLMAGTLGGPQSLPVFFAPFELGDELASQGAEATVCMFASTVSEVQQTWNVCTDALTSEEAADLPRVVVGSHLDSVPAGPGINDNGSGSSNTLEMAIQLRKTGLVDKLVNQVRFCFWGAEELGLKGSRFYVHNLVQNDPEEVLPDEGSLELCSVCVVCMRIG